MTIAQLPEVPPLPPEKRWDLLYVAPATASRHPGTTVAEEELIYRCPAESQSAGTASQREREDLTMATIGISIDDTTYSTADDDQEAASLLRLARRDPTTYDLFVIDKNGVETRIKDKQIVDLRPGMRFRTRRKLHFSIDGEAHFTWDDDQTAAALLRLAGVDPTAYDLARVNGSSGAGVPEIFSGEQLVTIRDGDEFVTAKHAGPVA